MIRLILAAVALARKGRFTLSKPRRKNDERVGFQRARLGALSGEFRQPRSSSVRDAA
jgi:hypothetical protein